jgi:hypothetical protein
VASVVEAAEAEAPADSSDTTDAPRSHSAQPMTGRMLGYSLLGGAGVLAGLMLLWLAVSGARSGGIVLGLILLVVLAGPLAIAGLVVVRRQPLEAAAAAVFASKRQVLDADRLFRHEVAPELRQLARQPALAAAHVEELAEDLERTTYDSPEWYSAVQLGDDDVATLKRYEDLVWERVRLLRDRAAAGAAPADLGQGVRELQQALDQRRDLLVRGRRAPTASPSVLVRAAEPVRGLDAVCMVGLGDAVTTADGTDYVVEGLATYFAEGQTWQLVHLAPAGPGASQRWLYIGPGGFDLGLLDEVELAGADQTLTVNSQPLSRVAGGTASVDVESRAGSARGVLITFSRYSGPGAIGLQEDWPDGASHAYAGPTVTASDLEIWPAQVRPPG